MTKAYRIMLASHLAVMGISLLGQILLARALLPEGRGLFAVSVMVTSLVSVLTHFGNEYGIRNVFVLRKCSLESAYYLLTQTTMISLILSLVVYYFIADRELEPFGRLNNSELLLSVMLGPTQLFCVQCNVLLSLSHSYRKAANLSILIEVLKLLAIAVALSYLPSLSSVLISQLLINIAMIAVYTWSFNITRKKFSEWGSLNRLVDVSRYGFKSVWLNVANFSVLHFSTLILSMNASNAQLGHYSIAFALASRLQVIPDVLNRVAIPSASELQARGLQFKLFQVLLKNLFLLCVVVNVLAWLLSSYVVEIFFGSAYRDAANLLPWMVGGFSFKVLAKPVEAYFNELISKPGLVAVSQVSFLVVLVSANLFFVPTHMALGAVLANSIAYALLFAILIYFFYQEALRCYL